MAEQQSSGHPIKLPDIGEGIAEAEVVNWHVAVGDTLHEDDAFVEVMTDKATVELPSPVTGVVRKLAAKIGDFVSVGAPLIWIDIVDDAVDDSASDSINSADPPTGGAPEPVGPSGDTAEPTPPPAASPAHARPLAAPAVRRRAANLGIDLAMVQGTGAEGRVVHADLDGYLTAGRGAVLDHPTRGDTDEVETIKLVGLRRNIAKRMQEAHRIPPFTYVEAIDVEELERLRGQLNDRAAEGQPRLTILPFLIRAVVLAIAEFPEMNARFDADAGTVERFSAVHLGIATQTPGGLMVPVIKSADRLDLWGLATEVRRLADGANDGTIKLADLTGSTITITSLGALGGIVTTPIINAPEVAIIGVNRIIEQVVPVDGQLQIRKQLNLSSSFDHRVIDGWNAAQFINRIKELLQTPARLFIN